MGFTEWAGEDSSEVLILNIYTAWSWNEMLRHWVEPVVIAPLAL